MDIYKETMVTFNNHQWVYMGFGELGFPNYIEGGKYFKDGKEIKFERQPDEEVVDSVVKYISDKYDKNGGEMLKPTVGAIDVLMLKNS